MQFFVDGLTSVILAHVSTSISSCSADIVAGSVDGSVRRFDVRAGACWVDAIGSPVTCVAISNDGHCLLAGCMDGAARLLDKGGGDLLATYRGGLPGPLYIAG